VNAANSYTVVLDFHVNGKRHAVEIDPDAPLLWVLHEGVGRSGMTYRSGLGACTVCMAGTPSCNCPMPETSAAEVADVEFA
jgi:aerobic-type carbon monoxide dehydrogenase small subunit (CoxS/CutS family)